MWRMLVIWFGLIAVAVAVVIVMAIWTTRRIRALLLTMVVYMVALGRRWLGVIGWRHSSVVVRIP